MTTLVLLIAVLTVALALIAFLSWLLKDTEPTDDGEDEDEDTFWFDPRVWPIVDRLFGEKPARLPHKPGDGTGRLPPRGDDRS